MPDRKLTLREQKFIELLPAHNWIIKEAGQKAGFTETYSKWGLTRRVLHNSTLKQAVEAKRQEEAAKTDVSVEYIRSKLKSIADSTTAHDSDILRACELLGRHKAMFTDKTEHTVRPGQLITPEEEEKQLKERLALLAQRHEVGTALAINP